MAKKAKFNPKTPAQKPTAEAQRQTQEARITANGRVISEHPATFITPAKLRALFEDAEGNDIQAQHELFADMEERDSAIAAALATRKLAVLGLDWRIAELRDASPAEQQLTQAAQSYFDHLAHLDDLLMDLMDAVGHGFAALEITWQLQGSLNMPARFTPIAQSWFRWDDHDNLLLKTPNHPTGEPLWQMGWVVHRHKTAACRRRGAGCFARWLGCICLNTIQRTILPSFWSFTACQFASANMARARPKRKNKPCCAPLPRLDTMPQALCPRA